MYEGKHKGGAIDADYDTYGMLAERYHWTPEQVDRLDPDYVDYLQTKIIAEGEHQESERKKQERERKREARKAKGGKRGEDADLSEIM